MKVVVASTNTGKLKEIQEIIGKEVELIPQSVFHIEEIEETGLSFVENALIKARHASKKSRLPALADDSGLVVNALNGAPGIYSARFAGINANALENNQKLLQQMQLFSGDDRRAHYHCTIVFVRHPLDPVPLICQAKWEGVLATTPSGAGGFGYDPLFYLPHLNCTAAELPIEQKNKLSHRAKALFSFKTQFKKWDHL